jgi:hypothetical protein
LFLELQVVVCICWTFKSLRSQIQFAAVLEQVWVSAYQGGDGNDLTLTVVP